MAQWTPIREGVIVPSDIGEDGALDDPLDSFLKGMGVKHGRRSTYVNAFRVIGRSLGYGWCPGNLRELMALGGFTSRDAAYSAFGGRRAKDARGDTAQERRQVLEWMTKQDPRFMVVDVATAPKRRGRVLKTALAVPSGLLPLRIAREEQDANLPGTLWAECTATGLPLPLVTTMHDAASLDAVLAGTSLLSLDHFAIVDRFYRPQSASLVLDWHQPSDSDSGLSFADMLYRIGVPPDGPLRVARVTVGRAQYIACGETASGRFYLQRFVTAQSITMALLKARVALCELYFKDAAEPRLDAWRVERLRMAPNAGPGYTRLAHAIVMSLSLIHI